MDADLVEMLKTSLAKMMAEETDRSLGQRLDELGWDDVVAGDRATAGRLLFAARGETLSSADVLGPTMLGILAEALGDPSLAGGSLVLPRSLRPDHSAVAPGDGNVVVRGIATGVDAGPATGPIVAPLVDGQEMALAVITAGATGMERRPTDAADLHAGLGEVDGAVATDSVTWLEGPEVNQAWTAAVAAGRWGLASELLAVAAQVIDRVVTYTGERKQYGKAIGSFQALQHRLAAAYATTMGAQAVVVEAATVGDPWIAMVAKSLAGRAAEAATVQAQQAYGAIGFTWEHDFHHHLRRVYLADRTLGDWRTLEAEIGRRLREWDEAPKIGTL